MENSVRPAVLIMGSSPDHIDVLNESLHLHCHVSVASSGPEGLRLANSLPLPDLILLAVTPSVMNTYGVLAQLLANTVTADIPVVLFAALEADGAEEYGLKLGAADFIAAPLKPAVVLARVLTQLAAKQVCEGLKAQNAALKMAMVQRMAENDLTQLVSIRALAHLAEIRDPETGNHLLRTQGYVRHLALLLQTHPRFASTLTPHYIDLLARSAPLHDIGKVGIPDNVLLKVGKLNAEEWVIMRTHAKLGSDAIEQAEKDIEQPLDFLVLAKEIAHWHHERWDGSGYPDGLAGNNIPLSARLMAVADVFDALISKRIYKAAMPTDQVCAMMAAERGKHFDPDLIDAFIADFERFAAIAEHHREEEEG